MSTAKSVRNSSPSVPSRFSLLRQSAVENRPAKEVGTELGMSPGAVYVARSRIVARLREQIQQMEQE